MKTVEVWSYLRTSYIKNGKDVKYGSIQNRKEQQGHMVCKSTI